MAIYFDLCLYETVLSSFKADLKNSRADRSLLKKFFQFAYVNYKNGIIGPKKLAYDVASTGEFIGSGHNLYRNLITTAVDLKLPDSVQNGNTHTEFNRFIFELEKVIQD